MAVSGRNKPRTSGKRKGEASVVDKILLDLGITALSFLPAGAIIRGGQLIYRGLKGARAMAAARKALADAGKRLKKQGDAAKSRKEYKPATTTKPKAEAKPATTTKKPKEQPKLTQQPKKIPKKKPGTAVTVTKPAPKPKRTAQPKTKDMKKADVTATATRTPKKVTGPAKPAPKPKKTLTKKQKAAIAAAVITGGAAVTKIATTKKPAEADPTPKKKRPVRPKADQSIRPKKITSVVGTDETGPDKSMPKAGKRASNRTSISAGPNTGFGLKGNIFPSNAKERRELMAKFGGTGSRAAKAAMAGTQGNIKRKKS